MKKPEILKGEVKEFIDWAHQDCYETSYTEFEDGDILKDSDFDEQLFFEMIDFFNQPFKPEMIEEYFEEGESVLKKLRFFTNFGNVLHPKTLSQFITNAIQAGIKLTWKD